MNLFVKSSADSSHSDIHDNLLKSVRSVDRSVDGSFFLALLWHEFLGQGLPWPTSPFVIIEIINVIIFKINI